VSAACRDPRVRGGRPGPGSSAARLYTRAVALEPAPILALLVGGFHAGLFTFLRGRADARHLLILVAAVLGAWAGDAIGGRLGIDPLRMGDFHLVSASLMAWAGIGFVAIVLILGPATTSRGR
jgi:hypothetical protein